MDYSIKGVENKLLRKAGQAIESDIASLQSSGRPAKEITSQTDELNELHLKIKQGEVYGLILAARYLAKGLPELGKPKNGQRLQHKKQKWANEDLKEFATLYGDEQSPYMVFHNQAQLTAIGEYLEKEASQWDREKLIRNCVIHMIRTEYYGQKSELLERRVKQLEKQISNAREKEYMHGEKKAKGRQKQYDPREDLYHRAINDLKIELGHELSSYDYLSWARRVLKEDPIIADTTLRTAFKRLTGCNPTSKKHVT